MKNFTKQLLIIWTVLLGTAAQAQWTQMLGGLSTGAQFNDFFAIDSNIIYVGGINGFLKKTTDGTNWAYARNGLPVSTFTIFSLHCTDANTCFASGGDEFSNPAFWTTIDGAASWQTSTSGVGGFSDIFFVNQSIGYGSGGSTVYKTINSGNTWADVSPPAQSMQSGIEEIFFTSVDVGFVVGADRLPGTSTTAYGKILKTIDGGATWTSVYTGTIDDSGLNDITFINTNLGFACGNKGVLLKTTDGGTTWVNNGIAGDDLTANYISIDFANQYTGLISHNITGTGRVRKTIDGGVTWTTELLPNYGGTVRMPHKNKGYVLDNNAGGMFESSEPGDMITDGIKELLSTNTVQIYPNPITNQSIIKIEEYTHSLELHVLDVSGKEVVFLPLNSAETKFEKETLLSGLYFYQITAEKNIISTGKIIIE